MKLARRAAGSFHPNAMPAAIRRNYGRELVGTGFLSVGRAAIEGSVLGGITRVAFDGVIDETRLNYAVAAFFIVPAAANIINFLWTRIAHGVNKTRFIAAVHMGMVASIAGLALMPATPMGVVGLIGFALLGWVFWSGFVAVRTTVWRANYARTLRARVAGKLSTIQTLTIGTLALVLGTLMGDELGDRVPALSHASLGVEPWDLFKGFLIVSAGCGLVGAWVISTIRVRRHKRMLAEERDGTGGMEANGGLGGGGPSFNPAGIARLLLEDRRYGRYQLHQFTMGIGNLMMFPLVTIILRERFEVGYFAMLLLSGALAMLIVPLAVPVWARLLDGMHVVRFRTYHSWVFVLIAGLLLVAAVGRIEWLLYVVAVLKGIGMGGGMLAWQLGHHDFAPSNRAGEYMGVHVTLTGVRGLIGPAFSVWLYEQVKEVNPELAPWTLGLCLGLVLLGALGFVRMSRSMDLTPAEHAPEPSPVPDTMKRR